MIILLFRYVSFNVIFDWSGEYIYVFHISVFQYLICYIFNVESAPFVIEDIKV